MRPPPRWVYDGWERVGRSTWRREFRSIRVELQKRRVGGKRWVEITVHAWSSSSSILAGSSFVIHEEMVRNEICQNSYEREEGTIVASFGFRVAELVRMLDKDAKEPLLELLDRSIWGEPLPLEWVVRMSDPSLGSRDPVVNAWNHCESPHALIDVARMFRREAFSFHHSAGESINSRRVTGLCALRVHWADGSVSTYEIGAGKRACDAIRRRIKNPLTMEEFQTFIANHWRHRGGQNQAGQTHAPPPV